MDREEVPDRWVIYSAFDPEGLPDEPSGAQLGAYRDAGFKTLVVDTSPMLTVARRLQWDSTATLWRQRENVGYDFGSYKYGIDYLIQVVGLRRNLLELVLANDSCFGPFCCLKDMFEYFQASPDEPDVVYGITDSVQEGHHLQSYWLYFRVAAAHHAIRFLESMGSAAGREEAIKLGELALSDYLRESACRLVPYLPLHDTIASLAMTRGRVASTLEFLIRRCFKRWKYSRDSDNQCLRWLLGFPSRLQYFNPVVLFGVQLYRTGRLPFLKKSMFRENVYKTPEIPAGLNPRGMTNAQIRRLLDVDRC